MQRGPGPDGKDPRIANPVLNRLISCQNMSMAQIADELQRIAAGNIYSPVLDGTGIPGRWNFTLSFSSLSLIKDGGMGNGGPPPVASATAASTTTDPDGAVSLFDALSKLGLKLEKQRRPVPVLVIHHIEEKPPKIDGEGPSTVHKKRVGLRPNWFLSRSRIKRYVTSSAGSVSTDSDARAASSASAPAVQGKIRRL